MKKMFMLFILLMATVTLRNAAEAGTSIPIGIDIGLRPIMHIPQRMTCGKYFYTPVAEAKYANPQIFLATTTDEPGYRYSAERDNIVVVSDETRLTPTIALVPVMTGGLKVIVIIRMNSADIKKAQCLPPPSTDPRSVFSFFQKPSRRAAFSF